MRATGANNNANAALDQGIDAYNRTRPGLPARQPPPAEMRTAAQETRCQARMARKIRSKKGAKIYARAQGIVSR